MPLSVLSVIQTGQPGDPSQSSSFGFLGSAKGEPLKECNEAMARVAVIGAGVGGLSAAALLAAQGCEVRVFERAGAPGGKMRLVQAGGAHLDGGPTVFTLRETFEALFDAVGEDFAAHVRLRRLDVLARHAWSAEERLDLFADPARSREAIAAFAGPREARAFDAFRHEAARIFALLRKPFLEADKPPGPLHLTARMGRAGQLAGVFALRPYETLWGAVCGHFRDPRLRQLFARYATYCGASPFQAPATLMLIAHAEQAGVWSVEGGMHALAQALARLAEAKGARLQYGCAVAGIEVAGGRARGISLESGERWAADAVVCNADPAAIAAGLFGAEAAPAVAPPPTRARSFSAVVWGLEAAPKGFALARHNVCFSRNYKAEFHDIRAGRAPTEPTIYVCAQDREEGLARPAGPERLLLIMNAPARGDGEPPTQEESEAWNTNATASLTRCGLSLGPLTTAQRTSPWDFARLFPGTGGAIYGRASHGWLGSFLRPKARTSLPGLYLAGGATHPGAGVPMAALSGRLAAQALLADRARGRISASFRPRAATPGGTWTPSAATAASD